MAHLYCIETEQLSRAGWHEVTWKGEKVRIELKANGTQVAAPPTPGYELLNKAPPMKVPSIEAAWSWVLFCFEKYWGTVPCLATPDPCTGNGRYPKPWRNVVPAGERNDTAYIEVHKLREAGITVGQAVEFMEYRFQTAYEQGRIDWQEMKRTIESAYQKGTAPGMPGARHYDNEFDRF